MNRENIYWKNIIKENNIVKIRQWDDMKKEYGISYERSNSCFDPGILVINCREKFTEEMKKYCGETIKINENMEKYFNKYGVFIYRGHAISTDMLEPYVVYEEELDVINIPVKDEYLKDLHEEKKEKEIIPYLEKEWGIKENAVYVIKYNDTEGKTFLGGDNFIIFKGKIINFTSDKCFIVDQEKGLAILDVKNIISMIPVKIN